MKARIYGSYENWVFCILKKNERFCSMQTVASHALVDARSLRIPWKTYSWMTVAMLSQCCSVEGIVSNTCTSLIQIQMARRCAENDFSVVMERVKLHVERLGLTHDCYEIVTQHMSASHSPSMSVHGLWIDRFHSVFTYTIAFNPTHVCTHSTDESCDLFIKKEEKIQSNSHDYKKAHTIIKWRETIFTRNIQLSLQKL